MRRANQTRVSDHLNLPNMNPVFVRQAVNDLYSHIQQARATLKSELAKLQSLIDQMRRTGTVPDRLPEQANAVQTAQASLENAADAYLTAYRAVARD
jgi:hypothetical protein